MGRITNRRSSANGILSAPIAFAGALALGLLALAWWIAQAHPSTSTFPPNSASAHSVVGVATKFDFVAVFPTETSSIDIERWRVQVLANPHVQACAGGRSCVQRMLLLAALGLENRDVLAFDLSTAVSASERAALLAAAAAQLPTVDIYQNTSPQLAANQ